MFSSSIKAKGMWGSRKKKEKEKGKGKDKRSSSKSDDDEMKDMEALYEELLSKSNGAKDGSGRRRRATITSPSIASADADSVNSLSHLVELYFSAAEKLIDSGEFEKLANPENLQRLLSAVPAELLAAYPQAQELLNTYSTMLENPEMLKALARQGLRAMREYANEMLRALSDPQAISAFMAQLPTEVQEILKSIQQAVSTAVENGDGQPLNLAAIGQQLQGMVDTMPGLDEQQRSLAKALLSGDGPTIASQLRSALRDPKLLEVARQQILSQPAVAEALGLSADMIPDATEWAALVDKGLDTLTNPESAIVDKHLSLLKYIKDIPSFEVGVNSEGDAELETMLNELLMKSLKKEGDEDTVRRRAA